MTGLLGKTTNLPRDVVGQQAQSERESMWGPIPGEIVSYDASKGTAEVKPLYKPRHNGKLVDMPNLLEVPIDLPRTGSAGLTFPIPAGTKVMLTPAMRSMESYDDANDGAASDSRSFALSDMRASISGGDSLTDPMKDVDADNTHLRFDAEGKFGVRGSPDGKIAIEGAQGNIYLEICEGFDQCEQLARYLSQEPSLIHGAEYDAIANMLQDIVTKLNAMAL
jgi:hypothetical protein